MTSRPSRSTLFPYTTLFRSVGLMSNYFRVLPAYRRELQRNELDAAERAGVDALVAVYHADHRELCAHERSEEHTSELQSRRDLVCRLLLEKKNQYPQPPRRF